MLSLSRRSIRALLKLITVILSMAILSAEALAMDCSKASSPLEKFICGDTELKKEDALLSQTYFKLLKAVPDPEIHDVLVASQRRWIRDQEVTFEDEKPSKEEVSDKLLDRAFWLGSKANDPLKAPIMARIEEEAAFAAPYTGGTFAGYDIGCWTTPPGFGSEAYICRGSQTFQNGGRICRSTYSWASGRDTEFRMVANVNGSEVKVIATCSSGADHTDFDCPDPTADEDEAKIQKWNFHPTIGGVYPEIKPRNENKPLSKIDPDVGLIDPSWIKACLSTPDYPPKRATRQ